MSALLSTSLLINETVNLYLNISLVLYLNSVLVINYMFYDFQCRADAPTSFRK
ncbi:hypothetical protein MADA3029_440009 [Vibrio nigripulchritudo MADA3029]|nr:hypothetical protein VIBNIMADA3020_700027 [Vibrio nigripulchritudo MADA3020]CCN55727.1 hypothetical protein VIBNIMADA3021_830027 [Vibrio nigripulchritudo MADA3021]CCN59576.1 hypothetical protein MADA3029_440009 [Vibrio nigripulchritudo MADA3029]